MAKKESTRKERLRELLLAKRQEILQSLRRQLDEDLRGDSLMTADMLIEHGDKATVNLADYIDHRILDQKSHDLKRIDEALKRLERGTYGICDSCGEEIEEKRLRVLPFATLCINCQRMREEEYRPHAVSSYANTLDFPSSE